MATNARASAFVPDPPKDMENQTLPPLGKLFTPAELAEFLRCTPQALGRMRQAQDGPPWVRLRRAVRYHSSDVSAWLKSKRCATY